MPAFDSGTSRNESQGRSLDHPNNVITDEGHGRQRAFGRHLVLFLELMKAAICYWVKPCRLLTQQTRCCTLHQSHNHLIQIPYLLNQIYTWANHITSEKHSPINRAELSLISIITPALDFTALNSCRMAMTTQCLTGGWAASVQICSLYKRAP